MMETHRLDGAQTPMAAAVAWFMDRADAGSLDLSRTLVATPGARAGRVLVTLLAQACQERGVLLTPPQTVTAGRLAEALAPAPRPADDLSRTLAWRTALAGAPSHDLRALLPEVDDPASWAEEVALAADELARGGFRCGEVAASELPPLEEPERWRAMGIVQARYETALAHAGLQDPSLLALDAAHGGGEVGPGVDAVVLLGCVDLSNLARALVRRFGGSVWVLVALDEGLGADGVVDEDFWRDAEIEVDPADVFVTGGPEEQGALAVRAALDLDTSAIGTADESLAGAVRRAGVDHGKSVHVAWGAAPAAAGPGRLLADLGLLLRERSFASLCRVMRCPAIVASVFAHDGRCAQIERALDDYLGSALPTAAFGRLPVGDERVSEARRTVARARRTLKNAIAPLLGEPRTLRAWAVEIEAAMVGLLDGGQDGLGSASLVALDAIGQGLRAMVSLPESLDARAVPAHEAVAALLEHMPERGEAGEPGGEDLDLLGWLELPLDPSPAMVVMGVHHSTLPAPTTPGPLLTEGLRRALGLPGEGRRLARDAANLATLLGSGRRVRFVLGTSNTASDPMLPSTLLLRGSGDGPARVLERQRHAFSTAPASEAPPACAYRVGVMREAPPIASMPVTSFRAFLESPYLFYLRYALRLREVEAPGPVARLEANTFGSLLHESLRAFAAEPDNRDITDQGEIRRLMHAALWTAAERLTGATRSATTLAQIDAAERRLRAMAKVEAERRQAGWRTVEVEWSPGSAPALGATGIALRGAIDRIDWHEGERRLALLDYKTADAGRSPQQTHRRRDGSWTDLQLPLYEVLARPLAEAYELGDAPTLGYVALTATNAQVLESGWAFEDLQDAHACAERIARRVRAGLEGMAELGEPRYAGALARLAGVGMLLDEEHMALATGATP
jgi:hypothetical protein